MRCCGLAMGFGHVGTQVVNQQAGSISTAVRGVPAAQHVEHLLGG